jgi:RNA polymerase sigma-70 factor (ECF subfamily)
MSSMGGPSGRFGDVTELWHKCHGQIYGYLVRVGVPAEAAEEMVVDAFLIVDHRWSAVRDYDRPEAFVYKVATNLKRWRYGELAAQRAELNLPVEARERPDDPADLAAMRTDVWNAIRKLSPRCREAVVLRYVEDFTVADTAAILDVSEGTVRSNAYDGLRRLSALLSAYDPRKGDR